MLFCLCTSKPELKKILVISFAVIYIWYIQSWSPTPSVLVLCRSWYSRVCIMSWSRLMWPWLQHCLKWIERMLGLMEGVIWDLSHLLVHMFRVLFYELFKADVVGTQFADPVENIALTWVKEGKVLGHLQQRPNTATTEHNMMSCVNGLCRAKQKRLGGKDKEENVSRSIQGTTRWTLSKFIQANEK